MRKQCAIHDIKLANCLQFMTSHFIVISVSPILSFTHCLVYTQSYDQFHQQYSQFIYPSSHQQTHDSSSSFSFLAPLTYDAVWTLALALHRVDSVSRIDADMIPDDCGATAHSSDDLGAFNYSNFYLGCRIRHELLNTQFVGVSVRLA